MLIFLLLFWGLGARAELETTVTLPQGIYSSKFTFGTYSGLDEKYNSSGLVQGVADQYHVNLSGKTLSSFYPNLKPLVEGLNRLSPQEHLGDQFSGGTLTFKAAPSVDYFVPTLSYGVTPNFSVGVGIPIIHFKNSIQVYSQGNLEAISKYTHALSSDIDKATSQLVSAAANLQGSVNGILSAKGYKPIQNEDFVAPGDLQISGVYRYYSSPRWRLAIRPYIQIPTGRPDDPDDLGDISTGDQPAVGIYSIHELQLFPILSFVTSVGYQYNIEDSSTVRVPVDGDDVFPGIEREETVSRRTGDSIFLEGGFSFTPYRPLEFRIVYDFTDKDSDWYQGDHPDWNYGLLSTDTSSIIHQIKALIEFSTLSYYFQKSFSMPLMLGYVYGNTFYASDAPRQMTHQLYMRMFF